MCATPLVTNMTKEISTLLCLANIINLVTMGLHNTFVTIQCTTLTNPLYPFSHLALESEGLSDHASPCYRPQSHQ